MLLKSMLTLVGGFLCTLGFTQNISPSGPLAFCAGNTVKITASGGSSYQWLLNGNNVVGGTQPVLEVSAAGDYKVVIKRTNGADTTLGPVTVTQNENPVVDFSFASQPCTRLPVAFTSNTAGAGLKYEWVFDDVSSSSNKSTVQNPTHIFEGNSGNSTQVFNVKLTVTNNLGCVGNITKPITLKQSPDANLGGSGARTYNGQKYFTQCGNIASTITFNNPSSTTATNTSYKIIWGDATADFTANSFVTTDHKYNLGNFDLKYTVTGGNGCVSTSDYTVFVGSNPGGSISSPSSTEGCTGDAFSFPFANIANNPIGTNYIVQVNDGTSSETFSHPPPPTYTHAFNKASCTNSGSNSFTVSYNITNPCSSTPGTIGGIRISQRPIALFSFSPKDTACVNTSVSLVNESPILYNVTSNGDCVEGKFIWKVSPATGFLLQSGSSLGNDFGATDPSSWLSGSKNLNLTFTTPGVYTVTLKIGGNALCGSDEIVKSICINPVPLASFNLAETVGCAPFKVPVSTVANTPNCGTNIYKWSVDYKPTVGCTPSTSNVTYLNGTTANSKEPVFSFNNPGVYTIGLTVLSPAGTCSTLVAGQEVLVKGRPVISSLTFNSSICEGEAISPVVSSACYATESTFSWIFDKGVPGVAQSQNPGAITYNTVGTFAVKVAVQNQCGITESSKNISVNPSPQLTLPKDTIVCGGTQIQTLSLKSANSATITWTNSNPSIGLKASGAGDIPSFTATNNTGTPITATITITAKLGSCTTTTPFNITVNPTPPPPTVTASIAYCKGDIASALSSATTGTIWWYDNATGGTASTTPPVPQTNLIGTINYYLSSVNSSGCESSRSKIAVTIKPVPAIADSSFTNPLTCAATTGSITLKGLQPNTPFIVHYTKAGNGATSKTISSNSAGTVIVTGLSEGTYNKIYVDLNGCFSNEAGPFLLSDPTTPPPPDVTSNGPICSTKDLKLTATTALTGTVSYQWSGPNGFTDNIATPVIPNTTINASGDYMVTVKQNNCTSLPASIKVLVNATPVLSGTSNNGPLCDTSRLELKTTAAPVASTYAWSGPAGFTSIDQNPVIPKALVANGGTYTVIATSIVGSCVSQPASTTVTIKPVPVITGSSIASPTACGTATGAISLQGLIANTSYNVSYLKNGSLTTKSIIAAATGTLSIANLTAATYSNVQVKFNGCASNMAGPFTLADPNPPATPITQASGPLCSGNTLNLKATLNESGTKFYTWQGPNNFTSSDQNPVLPNVRLVDAGTYKVTVTVNSCVSAPGTIDVVINPTPAQPVITTNTPVCSGNTITLSTPANDDYMYAWTGPNSFTASTANPTIPNANLINAGNYQLVVTTISGKCPSPMASAPVVVNPTPVIASASSASPTACGTATGSIVLQGLTANTLYSVSYFKDGSPATQSITATATGALTIANLTAATYTNIQVQLTGCPSNIVGPFTLADPNPPATPTAGANGPLCSGNTLNLTATSGETGTKSYAWQGPNGFTSAAQNPAKPNVALADAGTYKVTITINNCVSAPGRIDVIINPSPAQPVITTNTPVCSGNSITLSTPANADYGYAWSGPNSFTASIANPTIPNAIASYAGNYQLVVTTISGKCLSPMASAPVVVNPTPVITLSSSTNPNACGTATGAIELNGLVAGLTYTISYNGPGGLATLSLVANTSGVVRINNLFAGAYTNIVATLKGCPSNAIATVVLTDPNPPAAPVASGISPLCEGDTIRLLATSVVPNVSYKWSGPANFNANVAAPIRFPATANNSGKYYATVTINNCVSLRDSVEVIVNLHPANPVASSNSPVCREGTLQLNATTTTPGNVFYTWTGPNNFTSTSQQPVINKVTVAAAGTYTVIAKQLNCFSLVTGSTVVVVKPKPVIADILVNNPTSCGTYTGSIELKGVLPNKVYTLAYQWNSGSPSVVSATSNPAGVVVIRDLPAGTYTAITLSDNGCASDEAGPFELVNIPAAIPTIGSNGPLCAGSNLLLTSALAVSGIITYEWVGPNGFTSNAQNPIVRNALVTDAIIEPECSHRSEKGEQKKFRFDVYAFAFAVAFEVHIIIESAQQRCGNQRENR